MSAVSNRPESFFSARGWTLCGLAGGASGGIVLALSAPYTGIALTVGTMVGVVTGGTGIGFGYGIAIEAARTREELSELITMLHKANEDVRKAAAATAQQWTDFLMSSGLSALLAGTSMVCEWHANQPKCAEEEPVIECSFLRPATTVCIVGTMASTAMASFQILKYRSCQQEEKMRIEKQEKAQAAVEAAPKPSNCVIL